MGGMTEKGQADRPILIRSMADYTRLLGQRVSYGFLYDALDLFFREGGNACYVCRVVGPAAIKASRTLNDAGAAATLKVQALGPGDYANTQLKVAVLAGVVSGFRLQVLDGSNVVLETSPDLANKNDAFAWAQGSQYIELVDQASANNPAVVAAALLTGGTDDRANATDTHWKLAIDRATPAYGPGQVAYPGRTTDQAHIDLLSHAAANNRTAILDGADSSTVATHTTAASAARVGNQHFGGLFVPWLQAPGVVTGLARTLPPSPLVMARIAATDPVKSTNQPAAGSPEGESVYTTGVTQFWDDANRQTLNDNGVNVIRNLGGVVTIYGWRTLANPATEATWIPLGHQRVIMEIVALANAVMDQFVFKQIDGQGRLQTQLAGRITGEILPIWQAGGLYGATAGDAFKVDTGDTVNTPETKANNELRAQIQVRPSPMAEMATITIIKTPITEEIS
jgi:phage tail sheath protein FI